MIYDPIIITGIPRSRTSLCAGILDKCGLFMGNTCGPTSANKKGQFEHTGIIANVEKAHLKKYGYDPKGQKMPLPPKDLPLDLNRRTKTLKIFLPPKNKIWGFKDAKSCLSFRSWIQAFPNAKWIIVHRDAEQIAKSCQRTSFMNTYTKKVDWMAWVYKYRKRLKWLKEEAKNVYELNSGNIIARDYSEIKYIVEDIGLNWQALEVQRFIDPSLTQTV